MDLGTLAGSIDRCNGKRVPAVGQEVQRNGEHMAHDMRRPRGRRGRELALNLAHDAVHHQFQPRNAGLGGLRDIAGVDLDL